MNEIAHIYLENALTIKQLEQLHEKLLKLIHDPVDVVLQSASIEKVDTAGIQCIYAFKRDLEQMGIAVTWDNPSATLIDAARQLGFSELLGLA